MISHNLLKNNHHPNNSNEILQINTKSNIVTRNGKMLKLIKYCYYLLKVMYLLCCSLK
jgi:hypothetical protein